MHVNDADDVHLLRYVLHRMKAFSVTSVITSTLLEFAGLLLFNRLGFNVIPAGPTALVFSILYQFARLVPHAYTFKIFGVTFTNKIFMYILAFQVNYTPIGRQSQLIALLHFAISQLLISQPPGSVAASAIGLLAGQLYRTDALGLKGFRLPRALQRFASRFLLPLVGSTRPPRRTNRALPDDGQRQGRTRRTEENDEVITTAVTPPARPDNRADAVGAGIPGQSVVREWVDELTGRTERAASGLRVPSENEISQVTNMFSNLPREDIVRALQRRCASNCHHLDYSKV